MEKEILKIVPGIQALGLVGYNLKSAKKMFKPKAKKPIKNMLKASMGTFIGLGLIKGTSDIIAGM